jgi:tetratricopeptide (TPR) repeat protein
MFKAGAIFRIPCGRFARLALLTLLCAFFSSVAAAQADTSARAHFIAAQQYQQQGRLDEAAHEYQTVLRLQPGSPEAYVNLGLVYYDQAKFGDSARALAAAGKLRPGIRGVDLFLGIDYVKLNRPAQALVHLRAAVHEDAADKLAQSWLGTALWDAGQRDAALLQLRTAAAQFPNDPDLLFAAGEAYGKAVRQQTEELLEASRGTALSDRIYADVYAQAHDWTNAVGHLRRAIERDPRSIEAQTELGDVFLLQARFQDAKSELDQALAQAPRSAAVLARSGLVMILLDQPAEGLARMAKATEIDSRAALDALGLPPDESIGTLADPESAIVSRCRQVAALLETNQNDNPASLAAVAALYALSGDRDRAMRSYLLFAAGSHTATGPETLYTEALGTMHAHHYDSAEDKFVRWLAAHPDDSVAQFDLLRVRRWLTIKQIHQLVAIAPDSYHVHQLLGELYADHEEDEKAISEYRAVAVAQPDLPGAHYWLGHLYWKHGEADDAFRERTRELQLNPLHPEANGELGAVLVAQGHSAEAIPHLQSAIRSRPDLWHAYWQLGCAYANEEDYPQAEAMLHKVLAHDPDGSVHYQLGMVLRAEGKTAQAAQAFAEVRAIKDERISTFSGGVAHQ